MPCRAASPSQDPFPHQKSLYFQACFQSPKKQKSGKTTKIESEIHTKRFEKVDFLHCDVPRRTKDQNENHGKKQPAERPQKNNDFSSTRFGGAHKGTLSMVDLFT